MRGGLRWAVVPVLACFVLTGSGAGLAGATAEQSGAGQVFTVNVDGVNPKANETFFAYFPRVTTVHPGDTVVFHYLGVGEPHTVTLGTLADTAVSVSNHLTPAQQQANGPPASLRAADSALPQLFPQGPGDVVPAAADRCFVRSGPPGTALCPNSQHEQPDFDGTQSYYNSGWLDANQRFTVHLSSATPPGTYRFMCLLHREFMWGKLTVVPSSKTIMSPSAQYALGQKQQASMDTALAPAVAELGQGKPPVPHVSLPGANPALAGSGGRVPAQIDEFGPKTITIPVGGSVTWYFLGDHSITFNSDKTNNDIRINAPDNTAHLNPKALAPAAGPGEPPPGKSPTKGIHLKVVASSRWNGQGFHNSGVFINSFGPPLIEGYKLTFTRAGTYKYICTVHDHMQGKVVVGG